MHVTQVSPELTVLRFGRRGLLLGDRLSEPRNAGSRGALGISFPRQSCQCDVCWEYVVARFSHIGILQRPEKGVKMGPPQKMAKNGQFSGVGGFSVAAVPGATHRSEPSFKLLLELPCSLPPGHIFKSLSWSRTGDRIFGPF